MARKYPRYSIFFIVVMIVMALGLLWSASSDGAESAVQIRITLAKSEPGS